MVQGGFSDPVAEILQHESAVAPQPLAAPLPTPQEAPVVEAAPAPLSEAGPPEPPVEINQEQFTVEFERTHGRLPTTLDHSAARALPVVTAQLGRRPTKAELYQFLSQRQENQNARQQFEVTSGPGFDQA